MRALQQTGGKKGEAAKLLGISWPTLNKKIRQFGLEPPKPGS
ncbi:MAG: helix-turn-helix domain-containing protein [Planctomycetota bacterium]|jgi:DNA-binding protein Fis